METLYQAIAARLDRLKSDIMAEMERKGENASHRTERSLEVVRYDGGVKLVFAEGERAPMETLEVGRPGGAVPKGFYEIIKQWSRDKGIAFADERERSTFAYFVSRKIAREGTRRHKQHEDIYSSLTRKALTDVRAEVRHNYSRILSRVLTAQFNK